MFHVEIFPRRKTFTFKKLFLESFIYSLLDTYTENSPFLVFSLHFQLINVSFGEQMLLVLIKSNGLNFSFVVSVFGIA